MRSIKPAGQQKGFVGVFTKLIGDPGGSDVIGEFRLLIVLGPKIPGAVPTLWLVVNFLVEPLAPLPGTGTLDLRIATGVKDFAGAYGFITVGGKMGRQINMLFKKLWFL